MAKAPVKKDLVPTRATRLHNKSAVQTGAQQSQQFSVIVQNLQPEQFACVVIDESEHGFMVRRKKGSGSSKVIECLIPRKDVIEVTGKKGEQCIMRAMGFVQILKLQHQTVGYDKFGMITCTDAETGEVTRLSNTPDVRVSIVGEDVKAKAGAATARRAAPVARIGNTAARQRRVA